MERREFIAAMIAAPVATTIAAADRHTMRPPGARCPKCGGPVVDMGNYKVCKETHDNFWKPDGHPDGPFCEWWEGDDDVVSQNARQMGMRGLNQAINDLYRKMKAQA